MPVIPVSLQKKGIHPFIYNSDKVKVNISVYCEVLSGSHFINLSVHKTMLLNALLLTDLIKIVTM